MQSTKHSFYLFAVFFPQDIPPSSFVLQYKISIQIIQRSLFLAAFLRFSQQNTDFTAVHMLRQFIFCCFVMGSIIYFSCGCIYLV